MSNKLLTSKKGSTLAMVLAVLSILSILGIAVLSLSVVNFKAVMSDRKIKSNFYLAEAGLDEAYAMIGDEIENAIKSGKDNIDAQLPAFLQQEREKSEADQTYESNYIYTSDMYMESDGVLHKATGGTEPIVVYKGAVKQSADLETKINEFFREGYTTFLNDQSNLHNAPNDNHLNLIPTLYKRLNDFSQYSSVMTNKTFAPKITKFTTFPNSAAETDLLEIDMESKISKASEPTKTVSVIFKIKIPKYDQSFSINNKVIKLKKNALWSRAITTGKNIFDYSGQMIDGAGSGGVTIYGDVFAHGDALNPDTTGIIVGNGSKSGNLTINGNVYTGGYLKTNANNSGITINNPDPVGAKNIQIFCNTLQQMMDLLLQARILEIVLLLIEEM